MIQHIQQSLDQYWAWLKDRTSLREVGDWVEITTPFLDRHNDALQIYARRSNGGFDLTDDSYTINDLEMSGCELSSPKRRRILETTLNGFGVATRGDELVVHATPDDFGQKKHNLVQAMLAVNDLFFLASSTVKSLFLEDVEEWLTGEEVRFTEAVRFHGKSGFEHGVNFVIPRSNKAPERFLEAVTNPSKQNAQALAFKFNDIREVRSGETKAYAVLNDEMRIAPGVMDALRAYDICGVPWGDRQSVAMELRA